MTGILNGSYDPMLVVLSMGVATWASFVALNVASRIWISSGWVRIGWILAAATAMGGGVWSMHFIAMLAFSLPVPVGYSIPFRNRCSFSAHVLEILVFWRMIIPRAAEKAVS